MSHYLFTYGTLQPGANLGFFEQHHLEQYLTCVGKGSVSGELVHIKNTQQKIEYPGLIGLRSASTQVHGTVFEVRDREAVFPIMDPHEGYTPGLSITESRQKNYYERKEVEVMLADTHRKIVAEAYLFNPDSEYAHSDFIKRLASVSSGDWLEYVTKMGL